MTHELASTLDILPTIASLARAKLPEVMLDGVDITEILVNQGKVMTLQFTYFTLKWFHYKMKQILLISCLILSFQSKRETMMFYPTDPSEMYGLFALRLGKYKAHFYTRGRVGFIYTIYWKSRYIKSSYDKTPGCSCLCIRCYPQLYYPRQRLLSICSPQAPWPTSHFWPGGWPFWELPSRCTGKTWSPIFVGENQESQGAIWSLHGVWREPDIKRNRPESGALLQSSV